MRSIGAAKFKEKCLEILDNVGPEGILITKHGRPVAKLVAAQAGSARLIGKFKGRIEVLGNTLSTGLRWDAGS